ncbi:hypothetical protein OAG36_00780 [bacterium]|nr:hypothetical protein [bacterium]
MSQANKDMGIMKTESKIVYIACGILGGIEWDLDSPEFGTMIEAEEFAKEWVSSLTQRESDLSETYISCIY